MIEPLDRLYNELSEHKDFIEKTIVKPTPIDTKRAQEISKPPDQSHLGSLANILERIWLNKNLKSCDISQCSQRERLILGAIVSARFQYSLNLQCTAELRKEVHCI